jgi:hypothetical protein
MFALLITLFLTPVARDETVLVNEQAKLLVKYDHGTVSIVKVERQPLPSPARLPRWRGRFEARAVAAGKTLEFVRFDFPLMTPAEAPEEGTDEARKLGQTLRREVGVATVFVRAALPAGATSVSIYDSVTKKSTTAELPSLSPASLPAAGGGKTKR